MTLFLIITTKQTNKHSELEAFRDFPGGPVAKALGTITGQGTRSHMSQKKIFLKSLLPQERSTILCDATNPA